MPGCFYFFQQSSAMMSVCISTSAVFYSQLPRSFIQNCAYCKAVCIGKADTAYSGAFLHSFLCCPGIGVFLLDSTWNMSHFSSWTSVGERIAASLGKGRPVSPQGTQIHFFPFQSFSTTEVSVRSLYIPLKKVILASIFWESFLRLLRSYCHCSFVHADLRK